MSGRLARVVVGNIVINPTIVKEFLKKSHYFMTYDSETETIVFSANHDSGGVDLFQIRNASYENAVKLAEGLGLHPDNPKSSSPTSWGKWNPVYRLSHDGSEDAEKIRMEMLRLDLPFILCRGCCYNHDLKKRKSWAWENGQALYAPPMWTADRVIEKIKEDAERYKEQLASKP